MDIKFIKPFFDGTVKVFETMVHTKATPSAPVFKTEMKSSGDVSAVVSMLGKDVAGTFVLSFSTEVFLKAVSRMLGEEYKEITQDILDASAELANMIYGSAKKDLLEQGVCELYKAIPNIVVGPGHMIKYQNGNSKIFIVPFNSDIGTFYLELCKQDAIEGLK